MDVLFFFFTNFSCFVQETQSLERITPLEKAKPANNKIPDCCVMAPKSLIAVLWLLAASPELDEL